MSGSHLSKEFFDLVKSIGESRSKQEEDKIIVNEVHTLKQKMSAKDVPSRKMKEYLIRMIYVEMLGHDASFGHIHAVKMAHSRTLLEKRVGYLAATLTLHKDHSFMLLLVSTIQNDLASDNYLKASMALTVVAKLVNAETIPALMPFVLKLLEHKEGMVKKKAVMVLHRFHQIDPATIATLGAPIRKALCDSNISVMAASLNLFLDLCATRPAAYKDLVPDFVSILKQVIEHRLPRDYDYHRCPAPWVQLKLLQILAVLGASDKNASEGMYEILREVMKRADIGINVGYAIVYECVRTVTSIYPDASLIEEAASSISRFITSDNHNLKYLGVNALAAIVQIDAKYAAEHQIIVVDCLEDPDETLKRKTLDLLYSMTNPRNVTVIVEKLTAYLHQTTDQYLRAELVSRIHQLAEKYAPSNAWFLQTMNNVFEVSGATASTSASRATNAMHTGGSSGRTAGGPAGSASDKLLKNDMLQSILRLIAENAHATLTNYPNGEVPEDEEDIRTYAVDTYIGLLAAKRKSAYASTAVLPDILLQVCAWVLGEYGHRSSTTQPAEVLNLLASLLERQVDQPALTKSWILQAVVKMTSKILATGAQIAPSVVALVAKYQNSLFVDLQQRACEFAELLAAPATFTAVVPPENTFDLDLAVDEKLSFLDGYVATALKNGAKPYNTDPEAKKRLADLANTESLYAGASGGAGHSKQGLKFTAYAAPEKEVATAPIVTHTVPTTNAGLFDSYPPAAAAPAPQPAEENGLRLGANVARRWGPSGYNDPDASAAPAAAPAATAYQPTIAAMPASSPSNAAAAAAFQRQQEQEREAAAAAAREKERKAKELASRPRELTEREKMANSLFAGVGGAASTPPPKKVAPRPIAQQATITPTAAASVAVRPAAQPAVPVAAPVTDFLGGLIAEATPVAQQPRTAVPAAAADSLDLLFGAPSVAPSSVKAATAAPAATSPGGDLFDMFGSSLASTPAQAATAPAPMFDAMHISTPQSTTATASPLDAFGFGAPAPAASSPLDADLFGLGAGATKYGAAGSHMSAQLAALQKVGEEVTLINDARVQLTSYRAMTDQATIVALFLSNKSGASLANIQLSFVAPGGLAVQVQGDGGAAVSAGAQPNQHIVSFASLPARSTATQLVQLSVRDLATAFSPASSAFQLSQGQVAVAGSAPLAFACDLHVLDFLRPAVMKTDVYGAAWKQLTDEVKGVARPTTCNTPAEFMSRMAVSAHAHPVQTIGAENICACRVVLAPGVALPAPSHAFVLVHGKVHTHIDLIVRSKAKDLSAQVAKQLAVVLK